MTETIYLKHIVIHTVGPPMCRAPVKSYRPNEAACGRTICLIHGVRGGIDTFRISGHPAFYKWIDVKKPWFKRHTHTIHRINPCDRLRFDRLAYRGEGNKRITKTASVRLVERAVKIRRRGFRSKYQPVVPNGFSNDSVRRFRQTFRIPPLSQSNSRCIESIQLFVNQKRFCCSVMSSV